MYSILHRAGQGTFQKKNKKK